ncbi:MAG: FKBP-type peptidyl-prolyl cis-trans isomerase [Chitinophagaceae bacterium]
MPKVNVGGIVKIIIPSGLAYSIRTRSPKIPPNSNLVFEISVLSSKPKF